MIKRSAIDACLYMGEASPPDLPNLQSLLETFRKKHFPATFGGHLEFLRETHTQNK